MKKLLWGLGTAALAGAVGQAIMSKNHAKALELVRNLPTSLLLGPNADLDELKVHKQRLETLIQEKEEELAKLEKG